jgi:uncharacterized protein (TIGR03435 family)
MSSPQTGAMRMNMGADNTWRMEFSKVQVSAFADMLTRFVDRPVIDMTELKGDYQVALEMSMQDLMAMARAAGVGGAVGGGGGAPAGPADAASDPSSGSIFQSVQKLGLKLESRKAPVDIIVIDRLEKAPTEN